MIPKAQKPVCGNCGSDEIRVDAYAEWSEESHGWELSSTYEENAICVSEECDGGATSIKWVDVHVCDSLCNDKTCPLIIGPDKEA